MICNRTNRIHNCARIASDARTAIQPDGLTDLTTFSGKPCMKTVFFSGAIFSFFLSVCIAADAIKTQSVTTTWSPDPFENLKTIFNIGDIRDNIYIILRGSVDIKVPKFTSYSSFLVTLTTLYIGDKFWDLNMVKTLI